MEHWTESYWERTTVLAPADAVIVGAGITGLNAAISLKSREPLSRILVLDRGSWGEGASYRNAGFACLGSPGELLADLDHLDPDLVWSLVDMRWTGLRQLIARVGAKAMDLVWCGGVEIVPESSRQAWGDMCEAIPELNRHMAAVLGTDLPQFEARTDIGPFRALAGRVDIRQEGHLHPGRMMCQLRSLAMGLGVELIGGSELTGWTPGPEGFDLHLATGHQLSARRLGLATNGLTAGLVRGLDLRPARNQVYLTNPLPDATWDQCLHVRQGYVYARRVADRLLIGGARDMDLKGESTDQPGWTPQIAEALLDMVHQHFPVPEGTHFTGCWSGIMGVGGEKLPIIRRLDDGVCVAVRLGGMGVAIGTWVGEELARQLAVA